MTAPATLADVLARHAAQRPQAVAVRFEGDELTYAELQTSSEALAARLWHGWGVRPGDRVAWLGLNHPCQLVLLFALARIGAILLPLNFRLAPAEWDTLVADCSPAHIAYDDAWADAAQALARRHGLAAHGLEELQAQEASLPAPDHAAPQEPVLLVYTSGTTARPKAAVHTQANLLANMAIAGAVQEITPDDVVLTVLPLFHVGGLCIQTLPALYAGATLVLHARFDAGVALAAIAAQTPSLTLQVPATMKALIEHPQWAQTDLSSLRAVWAGSSILPAKLVQAFHARHIPVCDVYGATETGPFSIARGWPAPGVEVRLEAGEILVRAPNVVQRYWPQQPACDSEGWFHTGDLAAQAADGSYTVVGRAKDLIISGGENIHPAQIEERLAEHPDVAECAAFGLPDADWGEVVAVAIVLKPGAHADGEALRAFLAQHLARYKLPRRWLRVQALPKTALGKVQRQLLAGLPADGLL